MVICEQREDKVHHVSYELTTKARELADMIGEKVVSVILGENISQDELNALIKFGADEVIYFKGKGLKHFNDELYINNLLPLINDVKPEIVISGATTTGRTLMPELAIPLHTGLTADCTELDIDVEKRLFVQTRPAWGGHLMATIVCENTRPQMSTVRPKVMKTHEFPERKGNIKTIDAAITDTKLKILEFVNETLHGINIADAKIIVSGGRGIGSPDKFKIIFDLAKTLNAAVGASRAVVDAGWIPYAHQVGQTGTTVSPELYIACGISGAVQHQVGMRSANFIVAINTDKSAPIMSIADFSIVGNLFDVIPLMINAINQK